MEKPKIETKQQELNKLKNEARDLEKRGARGDEEQVLNILEPKIRELEASLAAKPKRPRVRLQENPTEEEIEARDVARRNGPVKRARILQQENPTEEEIEARDVARRNGSAPKRPRVRLQENPTEEEIESRNVTRSLAEKALNDPEGTTRDLNTAEIQALRETILKARESDQVQEYIDAKNDSDIAWYQSDYEKAGSLHKGAKNMEEGLKNTATEKMEESMLAWHAGDYETAKTSQDEQERIENAIGQDQTPVVVNTSKANETVAKYGQEVVDTVREMYSQEKRRLIRLGLGGVTLERRLAEFKRLKLEPILHSKNNPVKENDSIQSMVAKKDEEKFSLKKIWSNIKPSWWS